MRERERIMRKQSKKVLERLVEDIVDVFHDRHAGVSKSKLKKEIMIELDGALDDLTFVLSATRIGLDFYD